MKTQSWSTLTVGQFLDLYRISTDKSLEEMDKLEQAVGVIYNLTPREVEDLSMGKFTELSKQAAQFLTEKIPGKPVRIIKTEKRKYLITYNPASLRQRQYVEILHFGSKPVENMHLIMASLVQPITWYGRRKKNTAEDHPNIASDLLTAKVVDVYHACVFFCKLYINLIKNIRVSLEQQMITQGVTKEQASAAIQISIDAMAGFIPQQELQNMNE